MYRYKLKNYVLIFLVVLPAMLCGQTQTINPDSALQKILTELKGTNLKLSEAFQAAEENSPSVRRAKASYTAARGAVRREKGYFDPELFFSLNYEDIEAPTASFFSGAPVLVTKQTTSRTGLRMDLPIGTQLEASLDVIRLRNNSTFALLNPQYTATGTFSIRQPLLGGLRASARKELTRAERELEAAEARYEQEKSAVNAMVERAYWDLYAAERNYAVRLLLKQQGEAFLRDAQLRAQAGLIGPNQVASAQTFLAEQNILLLNEEEALDRLSDELYILVGLKPGTGFPRFIATDEPAGEFPVQPLGELLEAALENNADIKAAKAEVAASRVTAKAAGWEALPQVDLFGSLGGNGLTGSAQDVIFGGDTLRTNLSGSIGDAISEVSKRDFKTWAVGVEVSIPIGFRTGLGEKERLQSQVVIAEQNYIELARGLEERVRANHRELTNGSRRIKAALAGVAAAQEQVKIGLIEFRNGRTTAFELVRLSADFALAQQRYSEALVKTAKAAATLKELTANGF